MDWGGALPWVVALASSVVAFWLGHAVGKHTERRWWWFRDDLLEATREAQARQRARERAAYRDWQAIAATEPTDAADLQRN